MAKIAKVQEVDVSLLKPYERNAKLHGVDQIEKLCKSIEEFGFISPCLIDNDYNVIAGHGRIMAAKRMGMESVPCLFVEGLTDEQRRAYILADNRLTELGEWDMELVRSELSDLKDAEFDTSLIGFDIDIAFDESMAQIDDETWGDGLPGSGATQKSKVGDIYQLGKHRLMCGDSTNPEMVQKLMGGDLADLLLTDPPYNIGLGSENCGSAQTISGSGKKLARQEDGAFLLNDNLTDEQFVAFLTAAMQNAYAAMRDGAVFYVWYATRSTVSFTRAIEQSGLSIKQNLIWVKNVFTLGRQDYQWRHEPCFYGWKEGATHYFIDSRKNGTVFQSKIPDFAMMTEAEMREALTRIYADVKPDTLFENKPLVCDLHPTMKPVKLMKRLIHNSSKEDDIVLDLFGGSGSTLISCEELGRRCYCMEYDPHYADVIVERWEDRTGEKAVLLT